MLKSEDKFTRIFWEIFKTKNAHLLYPQIKNKIRGNHFHIKKIERFIVLHGSALIKFDVFLTKIHKLNISSRQKCSIDIPTYCT